MKEAFVGGALSHRATLSNDKALDAPLYGALDLGTNNCRLLMATPAPDGFRVVDAFSRITRLGEGLASSGALSEEAIDRTIGALKQCARRLSRRGVVRARAVATEACRRASNCASFLARVYDETGLSMETISADEEARLALAGCASLLDREKPYALVFDIGGGSTELLKVRISPEGQAPEVEAVSSLPLGVVTLAEQYGATIHCRQGYLTVVNEVARLLQGFDPDGSLRQLAAGERLQMLGTSGTVTTLAGVHLDLPRYDRATVDGLRLDFAAIDLVTRRLVGATAAERAAHPCIGGNRADLVVAGCAILEAICKLWPVGQLRVADRGVREGVLLSLIKADKALT